MKTQAAEKMSATDSAGKTAEKLITNPGTEDPAARRAVESANEKAEEIAEPEAGTEESIAAKNASSEKKAKKPATGKTAAEKPAREKTETEKTATENPQMEKVAAEKTETKKTAAKKTSAEKAEKPVAEIRDGKVFILQPGTKVYIKTADLCAMTGKSNQWIGQLTSQGVLFKTRTAHGNLYEMHDAVGAYVARLDRKNVQDQTKDDLEKQKLAAEIELKEAKAAISRFDVEERRGAMHRSEDVAAMTEDLIYAIRGSLLALPGRLAVNLVGVGTAAEAAELVRREVYQVMQELSAYEYDPEKYKQRVRERMRLEAIADGEDA